MRSGVLVSPRRCCDLLKKKVFGSHSCRHPMDGRRYMKLLQIQQRRLGNLPLLVPHERMDITPVGQQGRIDAEDRFEPCSFSVELE